MSAGYPFTVPETRLAEALGLPRKAIKDVRTDALTQGTDWDYCKLEKNHGAVVFSRSGVERTLAELGIAPEKISLLLPPSEPAAPASPPPPTEPVTPCEGCEEPATTSDTEGVWLCAACAATLAEDDLATNDERRPDQERSDLLSLLSARAAGADPAPSLDLTAPDVVEVTIVRTFTVNRRIVSGTAAGEPVRVRVRTSEKLRVGMVLRCTRIERDLYELAERLPRRIPTA